MSPIIRAGPTRTKRGLRFIEALEEEPVFGSAAAGEGPQAVEGVTAEGRAKSARVRAGAREKAKRYHQSDERVIFEAEGLGRKTSGMLGDKRRIWQEYQRGMFRNFMNSIRRERGG